MKSITTSLARFSFAVALSTALAASAATIRTWNGGGGADGNWATGANWGGTAPASGDQLIFTGSAGLANTNNLSSFTAGWLQFGADGFSLWGNQVTLGGNLTNTTGSNAINMTLALGSSARTITVSAGTLTLNGVVSGSAGFTKQGSGMLTLTNNNSFTGAPTINAGALTIKHSNALGTGTKNVTINNGSSGGCNLHLDGSGGPVTLASTLTLLTSRAPYTIYNDAGDNAINGNIQLTSGGGDTGIAVNAGSLTLAGSLAPTTTSRNLLLGGAANGTVNGPINDGSGANLLSGVKKQDAGTWTLKGTNLYTGSTFVNGGTLILAANGSIANSRAVTVAAGATFDVSTLNTPFVCGAGKSLEGAGVITGDVTVAAGGMLRPGGAGAAGTLSFSNNLTLTATTTNYFELGAATTPGGGNDLLNVAGNFEPNGAALVISSVNVVAPGTYRLINYGGSKSTSFGSVVSADTRYTMSVDESVPGQVNLVVSGTPADLVWSGGGANNWDVKTSTNWNNNTAAFAQADTVSFDDMTANTTVNLTTALYPGSVTISGGSNYTFQGSGKLSGVTGLTKNGNGTLYLNTANDYTGVVSINGGTVVAGSATALGATNGGTVVAGGTLDTHGQNLGAEALTIAGSGAGGVGAIINTGADQYNTLQLLTLADNASIGGTGRWDVRGGSGSFSGVLNLNGYTLTKAGANKNGLVDAMVTNAGTIVMTAGTLAFTRSQVTGDGWVDVGTNLLVFENNTTGYVAKPLLVGGGTIQLTGSSFGVDSPITNNNATFDVASGLTLTLSNTLSGPGALTKVTAGTLSLQQPDLCSGSTTINGGTLQLGANSGLPNTPSITVGSGATLDASSLAGGLVLASGQQLAGNGSVLGDLTAGAGAVLAPGVNGPGTLTLANNATFTDAALDVQLGANPVPGDPGNDFILVGNGLTLNGVTTINVVPTAALNNATPYTLMQYGWLNAGTAANLKVTTPSRYAFTVLDPATTAPYIQVQVSGTGTAASLLWRGGSGGNPTAWDLKTSQNWLNGAAPDLFYAGDEVTFDDTAVTNLATLTGSLVPAAVVMSNNVLNYVFGGTGAIASGSLTAYGSGSLTVANGAGNSLGALDVENGFVCLANAGANSFLNGVTVNGGTLALANPAVNSLGAFSLNGGAVIISNNAANTFSSLALNGGTLTFNQPVNLTFGTAITGGGSLVKEGTNTLTLSGANAGFVGALQVNQGILRAGSASGLGSPLGATTIAPGATLDVNAQNLGTEPVTVSGAGVGGLGALVNNSASQQQNALHDVTLAGDTTFGGIGRWDIRTNSAGMANLNTGGAAWNLTKTGANYVPLVSVNVDSALGDIDVQQGGFGYEVWTSSLGDPNYTLTVESNAYFQMWNAANPLAKRVVLRGGSQVISGSGAANTMSGPVQLAEGVANFQMTANLTLSGQVTGAGALNKTAVGTLTLTASNSYAEGTTLKEGYLQVNNDNALGTGPVVVSGTANATRLLLGAGITVTNPVTIVAGANPAAGNGCIQANGGGVATVNAPVTVTANATGGGHFGASGAGSILSLAQGILVTNPAQTVSVRVGTVQLAGGGNYTSLSHGQDTLVITADDGVATGATLTVRASASSTFDLNGHNQRLAGLLLGGGGGTGSVTDSSATPSTLTLDGTNANTFAGLLTGNLALVKQNTNTLTLTAANTYSGSTTIAQGTLALGASGSISSSAVIDVLAGAAFDVSAFSSGLTLGARQTLTGNGTVNGSVTTVAGATLAPGDAIGSLTVTNLLVLGAGSTNVFELDKSATLSNDVVNATTVVYGGTLLINNLGPALVAGDRFKLFNAGSCAGSFAAIVPATPGAGLVWDTSGLSAGVLSVATAVSTVPPTLTNVLSGKNLNFSWPEDHLGWRLEVQTNALGVGLSNNWFTWPNSTNLTSVSIPADPANPAVFFRLVYP